MTCGLIALVTAWVLQDGDGELVTEGTLDQWAYGLPSGAAAPVWATRIDRDTLHDAVEDLLVPLPATEGLEAPVFVLQHRYTLGAGDTARLLLDDGSGPLLPLAPAGGYPSGDRFSGTSSGTRVDAFALPSLPAPSTLRLRFEADDAGAGPGWTIEDLALWDGDPLPPRLESLVGPDDTQDLVGPYPVQLSVADEDPDLQIHLLYDVGGGEQTSPMVFDGTHWNGTLPAQEPGTTVSWRVDAEDCAGRTELAGSPFRVFLAPPTALQGPTGPRLVTQSASLTWEPPVSPWPVIGYEVRETTSGATWSTAAPGITVPLEPGSRPSFEVAGRFLTPMGERLGDGSATLTPQLEVPGLSPPMPSEAYQGERVYVELTGQSLYLLEGLTTARVLPAAQTISVDVLDVDRAVVLLQIEADAVPGPQDVEISGTHGVFLFEDAFEVLPGEEAPRIVSVLPERLVQGDEATVAFTASRPLGHPVEILVDDDLIVASEPAIHDATVEVRLVAQGRARPGEHAVIIDDGTRLYPTSITIDEYRGSTQSGCSSPGVPGALDLLPASVTKLLRRRPSPRCRLDATCEMP